MSADAHIPVLLAETVAALAPADGKLFVDGTFGRGGVSRALLEAADCRVLAIDRDPEAIAVGRGLETDFGGRFRIFEGLYSCMEALLAPVLGPDAHACVDGVTADIGVSSPHIDKPERGFSFQADGPLSMRMGGEGVTAADIVNQAPEAVLKQIIKVYGEERHAGKIARAIVRAREEAPLTRTLELAHLIERVVHRKPGDKIHPATRTFQALRLAVNDELRELAVGLSAAERLLKEGGRLAVVTFHSLEARIVKRFLAERAKAPSRGSRHLPDSADAAFEPQFRLDGSKPIEASPEELARNPRARSAQLRAATRTGAPARSLDLRLLDLPEVTLQ